MLLEGKGIRVGTKQKRSNCCNMRRIGFGGIGKYGISIENGQKGQDKTDHLPRVVCTIS